MEYGLFSYEEGYTELMLYEPHLKASGLNKVFSTIESAVDWIKSDTQHRIIVIMPCQLKDRNTIERALGLYYDQCVAIDTIDKYSEHGSPFSYTEKLSESVPRQIGDIIKKRLSN